MTYLCSTVGPQQPAGVVVNRTSISGSRISSEEAKLATDSGIPGYHYAGCRQHYFFIADQFPETGEENFTNDASNNRLPICSTKVSDIGSWVDATNASPSSTGVALTMYNNLARYGDQMATWQDGHRGVGRFGATFPWSLHHEPNDDDVQNVSISGNANGVQGVLNYQSAVENIIELWKTRGVTMWEGDNSGFTTQEGLMLGLNLITGESAGGSFSFGSGGASGSIQKTADWGVWWPNTWTWGNQNMVLSAADSYNNKATITTGVFKTLEYTLTSWTNWNDQKRTYLASIGRPFLTSVWETGTTEESLYNSIHSSWTATGLAKTKANWFLNALDWLKELESTGRAMHHWTYWDSQVTPVATSNAYQVDTSIAAWNGWIAMATDPWWNGAPVSPSPLPERSMRYVLL